MRCVPEKLHCGWKWNGGNKPLIFGLDNKAWSCSVNKGVPLLCRVSCVSKVVRFPSKALFFDLHDPLKILESKVVGTGSLGKCDDSGESPGYESVHLLLKPWSVSDSDGIIFVEWRLTDFNDRNGRIFWREKGRFLWRHSSRLLFVRTFLMTRAFWKVRARFLLRCETAHSTSNVPKMGAYRILS